MKYVCELCGMIYDEEIGDPRHGYPAGTKFADLPEYYECPGCGSEREAFSEVVRHKAAPAAPKAPDYAFWHGAKYGDDKQESER